MSKSSNKTLLSIAFAATAATAFAQEPLSRETAILPVPVKAGRVHVLGLPFTPEPIGNASAAAGTSGTTVISSKSFAAMTGSVSFMVTKSTGGTTGALVGKKIGINEGASSGTTIILDAAIAGLAVGDEFTLIPDWTLGTLFGTTSADLSGLYGGSSVGSSDEINFIDASGVTQRRYFDTAQGFWVAVGGTTNLNDEALNLNGGLIVKRPGSRPTRDVYLEGVVRKGKQNFDIKVGANIYFHTNPRNVTLVSSGLRTGANATGVRGGSAAASADTVTIVDAFTNPAATTTTAYYYNTTDSTWHTVVGDVSIDGSLVNIPAGTGVVISRSGPAGVGNFPISEYVTP